jgi:O-antigen/teichoic acid export membrane protein
MQPGVSTSKLASEIDRGVAWVGAATSLVALFDVLALALILHYWMSPTELGVVSAVVTVFPFLTLLAELGLPAALIRGEAPSEAHLSTVFWLGLGAGVIVYALVFVTAPWLAALQGHAAMAALFRVSGLVLVIRPFYAVHRALLRRNLRFRGLSIVRVIANFVELGVKVGLAAAGYALWSLAVAPLARELVYAIGVPACTRWWPRWRLQLRGAGADLRFGLRASASELLYQLYSNADYQVVSLWFGAAALGLYRAAYELVIEPVRVVSEVVTVVAFPTFARLLPDRAAVAQQLVRFARQNLIVVLTLVAWIVVSAEDLLTALLGARYAAAANAARILAVVGVVRALSHLGPPLLDGTGRPDLTLRYQATAAVVLPLLFAAFAQLAGGLGFSSVALAWAVGYPVAFAVLIIVVRQQVELPTRQLLTHLGRISLAVGLAALLGGGVQRLLAWRLGVEVRLVVTGAVVIGGSLGLLAALREWSPRQVLQTLRR